MLAMSHDELWMDVDRYDSATMMMHHVKVDFSVANKG